MSEPRWKDIASMALHLLQKQGDADAALVMRRAELEAEESYGSVGKVGVPAFCRSLAVMPLNG